MRYNVKKEVNRIMNNTWEHVDDNKCHVFVYTPWPYMRERDGAGSLGGYIREGRNAYSCDPMIHYQPTKAIWTKVASSG